MKTKKIITTGILICFFASNVFSQKQVVFDNSIGYNHGYLGNNDNTEDSDPSLVKGHAGKALDFDGADDFVLIPDSDCSSIDISGGPLTISAWVNPDSQSDMGEVRSIAGKGNTQYMLGQVESGWHFLIHDGENELRVTSNAQPSPGQWTHLLGRYDPESDDLSLWVNGEKQNNTGVSGGAEPGSFMNLETPVAKPPKGETVSVTDYGAVPNDGKNDINAIQQAFNSGKNVMFPDGVYDISRNLYLSMTDMADKTIFAKNDHQATIRSSGNAIICHYFYNIKGILFKNVSLNIYGGGDKNSTRFIQNNKFEKPYQNGGPSIQILKDQKVENLIINNNSFIGGNLAVKVGDRGTGMLKNSYIENNYSEGVRRHYNFYCGAVNVKIRNNVLQGEDSLVAHHPFTHKDIVGIGFFNYKYNTPIKGNIIENNTLHNIYEEGISFDPFGRSPDSYSRWTGSITDWESSKGNNIRMYLSSIPNTSEWNDGSGYKDYHILLYEDVSYNDGSPLRGKTVKIKNAGVDGGRAYIDVQGSINESLIHDDVHGLILAHIPRNILIRNNYLHRIGRTGINVAAGFNFLIDNNTFIDCNLQEDTHPTHRLRWGGVSIKTKINMNTPGKHSPTFYHSVMNNSFSGQTSDSEYGTDITFFTEHYQGEVFRAYGNTLCGNIFSNGASAVVMDVEDCPPASNGSNVAIGYNPEEGNGYFDGKIDDVQIYRRALSDEEVTKLANGEDIGDTFLFGSWKFDSLLQKMPSSVNKSK